MENNKNKKSVKFQGDMLIFYDFIQVLVFTTNHYLKPNFFFNKGASLIGKNLLSYESKFFPLASLAKRLKQFHVRLISLGGVSIYLHMHWYTSMSFFAIFFKGRQLLWHPVFFHRLQNPSKRGSTLQRNNFLQQEKIFTFQSWPP